MKLTKDKCIRIAVLIVIMLCFSTNVFGQTIGMKKNISVNKIWKIQFTDTVGANVNDNIYIIDQNGERVPVKLDTTKDNVEIRPHTGAYNYGEKYTIHIKNSLESLKGEKLGGDFTYEFETEHEKRVEVINTYSVDRKFQEAVDMQYERKSAVYQINGRWETASKDMIEYYMNPDNFKDEEGMYQFLSLNYIHGIKVDDINRYLKGRGMLEGMGEAVLEGAKKYNLNPAYLIAHMILETGHGKSKLARGMVVSEVEGSVVPAKTVYNMYGIQAVDSAPNRRGSEYAYEQGWFTPEIAIIEGAKWVGEKYINSEKYNQNTLYKMRWNNKVIWHQYSTDVRWVYNQTKRLKEIMDSLTKVKMIFDIPVYR